LRGAFKRWPDMQITIEKMVAEGDTVAWCFVVQGSKANGQVARFWALSMIRFVAGKMAEEWEITAPVEAQP
jgi:predicted ester cyclase